MTNETMNGNLVKPRKSDCTSHRVSLFQSVLFFISSKQQTNGSNKSVNISSASCLSTQRVLHIDFSLVRRSPSRTSAILFSRASCLFSELKKKRQTLSAVSIVFLISAMQQLLTTHRFNTCCAVGVQCLRICVLDEFCCSPAFSSHSTSSIVRLPTEFACRKLPFIKQLEDVISNSPASDTG